MLGLSRIQLGIMIVLAIMVPLAFKAGEWHQEAIDTVDWNRKVAEARLQGVQKAQEAERRAAEAQAAAEDQAQKELDAAKAEGDKAEEASRAKDQEIEDAQAKLDAAQAKQCPVALPPPRPSATRFSDDELRVIRKKYPAGPIGRH